MDKLELDDRVSRLERRVSLLSALALLALLVPAVLVAAYMMRPRGSMPPAAAKSTPVVYANAPLPHDTIAFGVELRRLYDLQQQGLITSGDFAAKKADVLGRSMEFGDEAEAVKAANALLTDNIITTAEYDVLKRKILKLDR